MSKLKQIREQQNLTQEELSEKSGISVRTIQRIESGTEPKGHTLKTLSKTLEISVDDLLNKKLEVLVEDTTEKSIKNSEIESQINYQKVKMINLSSVLFVLLPPLNILVTLILSYSLKQKNQLTNHFFFFLILWTILAPIVFMLGIFLKLGQSFTIVILLLIILSNVYLILRNLAEIDRKKQLRYKLNFSIV